VAAWQYLRELVCHEVDTNIQWVWCPYAKSYPTIAENTIENYFPGDEATDWVALNGYNWGTTRADQQWLSFKQIFQVAYQKLTDISQRPIMIAETACPEIGGDKAKWIEESFDELFTSFKRERALVWFDIDKECDWRMASSPNTLEAFRSVGKRFFKRTETLEQKFYQ
jgi:beta-mannanase